MTDRLQDFLHKENLEENPAFQRHNDLINIMIDNPRATSIAHLSVDQKLQLAINLSSKEPSEKIDFELVWQVIEAAHTSVITTAEGFIMSIILQPASLSTSETNALCKAQSVTWADPSTLKFDMALLAEEWLPGDFDADAYFKACKKLLFLRFCACTPPYQGGVKKLLLRFKTRLASARL